MSNPKILAFAGSLRTDSYNKKLAKIAADGARKAGAEVTYIDLRELPLPIYDQDFADENNMPENAIKLKELMRAHQGFIIASPEYNSGISGALKNAIDWASRPGPNENNEPIVCFKGKVAVLMSASPGELGGLRGLAGVRSILGNIDVLVLPEQVAIKRAHEAFNPDGILKDSKQQKAIEGLGEKLATTVAKLQLSLSKI